MMRILFVCPTKIYGGGEVYLKNIINGLACNDLDMFFLSPPNKVTKELDKRVNMLTSIEVRRNYTLLKYLANLNEIIKSNEIDVVFLNGYNEIGWLSTFIKANKIIVCGHNNFDTFSKDTSEFKLFEKVQLKGLQLIQYYFFKKSFSKINKFICINDNVFNNLKKLINIDKLSLIYNGVQEPNLLPKKKSNKFVIGRIGRLIPLKRNDILLEATAILKTKGYPLEVVFAGEGAEYVNLLMLTKKLNLEDEVNFLGHVNVESIFNKIDCLISCSEYEASPLVILESMASSVVVISTDVGACDSLLDHGKCGLLVPKNNALELSNAIESLIINPVLKNELVENAKRRFLKKYTLDNMVNLTRDLL
jgi:glycosyltransferase involved in cell wall biosynthesis